MLNLARAPIRAVAPKAMPASTHIPSRALASTDALLSGARRRAAIVFALLMGAGLTVLGFAGAREAEDGVQTLYALPVALFALVCGLRWGALTAMVALVFVGAWGLLDGTSIPASAYLSQLVVLALTGPVLGYLSDCVRAATGRERLADEAFRRGEEQLNAGLVLEPGIALIDAAEGDFKLPRVNGALVRLSGFDPGELSAMSLFDLVEPRGATTVRQLELAAAGRWDGPPLDAWLKGSDGERAELLLDCAPAEAHDENAAFTILRVEPVLTAGRTADAPTEPLSERELEVLRLVAAGMSGPGMAKKLYLSPETIKTHLRAIYRKLGVADRAAAVAVAMRQGTLH